MGKYENVNPAAFKKMQWHTEEEYMQSLNAFLDMYAEQIIVGLTIHERGWKLLYMNRRIIK
ncbi:hypothetical protein [Bacillus clarus]|uniref:hypothetical protein n=1 Tax=Bacillus clarus TaxID=2338372 RepID=UPI000B2F35FF